jgi:hypothetical protein
MFNVWRSDVNYGPGKSAKVFKVLEDTSKFRRPTSGAVNKPRSETYLHEAYEPRIEIIGGEKLWPRFGSFYHKQ